MLITKQASENILFAALNRLSNQFFRLCVCVLLTIWLSNVIHWQFFIIFRQILHTAKKCGQFDTSCLWDKLEVEITF